MTDRSSVYAFIRESNAIEGIHREPTLAEVEALSAFLSQSRIMIGDLCNLVSVFQPGAKLRTKAGMDVRIGSYLPMLGGEAVSVELKWLLHEINNGQVSPYQAHQRYERLHPFMDGNGRSGRALWLWMMGGHAPLGFLHTWYYQSLAEKRDD